MDRNLARKQYDYLSKNIYSYSPKHILVINWHGKIGDAIISSFFFREIKKKYKDVYITVITAKNLEILYRDYFGVNQLLIIDELSYKRLVDFLPLLKDVDTVIPLIGILDVFHIFFLGKIHPLNILGIDPFLQMVNPVYREKAANMIVHDMYRCMLNHLGCRNIDDSYIIPFAFKPLQEKYSIIFNPFGSRDDKSLCLDKTVSLLKKMVKTFPNETIGVLSSPSTFQVCQNIVDQAAVANIFPVSEIDSFYDIIPYISASKLVISVDTSVVHIAAGLHKKIIAIYYGSENTFNCWVPRSDASVDLIYSKGSLQYLCKNMNNFDDDELIMKAKKML